MRYDFPHIPDEPDRLAVNDWLRQHGIDPNNVAVPGWIEVSDEQITYETYPEEMRQGEEDFRETRTVRLDVPPAPFPLQSTS